MFNSISHVFTASLDQVTSYFMPMLEATLTTLFIAIVSLAIGLVLAFAFALLESIKIKYVARFFSLWVMAIRGLPEILIVIAVFNGLPLLLIMLNDGFSVPLAIFYLPLTLLYLPLSWFMVDIQMPIENFDVSPISCGIVALSMLYAAYASQTLRGALHAVPQGQRQAAETLGLSKSRTFFRIVMPQMWRHALPGLGNQWLVLLKDTALVSLISVSDIMMQTKNIIANTREPFTWYLIAAAIYLIISMLSQKILQRIEKRSLYFENPSQLEKKLG